MSQLRPHLEILPLPSNNQLYDAVMVVVRQKLGRKCSIPTESRIRDLSCPNPWRYLLTHSCFFKISLEWNNKHRWRNIPPKVFYCVKGGDEFEVGGPVFGFVIFEEPERPSVLQRMFDQQLRLHALRLLLRHHILQQKHSLQINFYIYYVTINV